MINLFNFRTAHRHQYRLQTSDANVVLLIEAENGVMARRLAEQILKKETNLSIQAIVPTFIHN